MISDKLSQFLNEYKKEHRDWASKISSRLKKFEHLADKNKEMFILIAAIKNATSSNSSKQSIIDYIASAIEDSE